MGVPRPRTWRLCQIANFKFLVSCYREQDGNVQRGVGAFFLFLPSCANVVEISLRPKKKKPAPAECRLQRTEIMTKHNYINSLRLCEF